MSNLLNQNDVICFKSDDDLVKQMSPFDLKKNIEDSIKDGLMITATATRIFFALKAANVKPQKAPLDAKDMISHWKRYNGQEMNVIRIE